VFNANATNDDANATNTTNCNFLVLVEFVVLEC